MAHVTPQFDIKTGADSQLFFSREITKSDVVAKKDGATDLDIGRIRDGEIVQESDAFNYPQLTRRTGHSIKGSTETIQSNELRKGRTKSAPRKGNSSAEGSLDIELSPETYDDIFEAALRNKWRPWVSDEESKIKFDFAGELKADQFISNGTDTSGTGLKSKYLVGYKDDDEPDRENAVILFENETERNKYEIDELTCGTEDIKYSALAQYGGIEGDDLYQEFQHLAVNTMSLSVSPGQIVTGSFGFMGANNPDLLGEGQAYEKVALTEDTYEAGKYYVYKDSKYVLATEAFDGDETYYEAPKGLVESLADDEERSKEGRFFGKKTPAEVKDWVKALADKTGTTTDQFTAREGFLYINGHRVQYGSNLTFELNNGLKQIFAIFEKGSISTKPMELDITGTLDAYLIKGYSEDLYNMCTQDKDVEITFCFQDQEDNPEYLYVMQIFKAKFTSSDISQGAEELTISLPFQSFEERACRFFRIRKRTVDMTFSTVDKKAVEVTLFEKPDTTDGLKVSVSVNGVSKEVTVTGAYDKTTGKVTYSLDEAAAEGDVVEVAVTYNGKGKLKTYTIA